MPAQPGPVNWFTKNHPLLHPRLQTINGWMHGRRSVASCRQPQKQSPTYCATRAQTASLLNGDTIEPKCATHTSTHARTHACTHARTFFVARLVCVFSSACAFCGMQSRFLPSMHFFIMSRVISALVRMFSEFNHMFSDVAVHCLTSPCS
jgi:hypothetical protein